jgi:CheY-like chemotaxis protein
MNGNGNNAVLQVEDDENDVFLLRHVFKEAGIESPLHVVADGQMAIEYLSGAGEFADREKHPLPCLVLMDLKMPRCDGLEALAWIRQQPQFKGLVVVLLSSSALPQDVERAYELGANSYIQKPSSKAELREMAQLLKGWWLRFNHYPPLYQSRTA